MSSSYSTVSWSVGTWATAESLLILLSCSILCDIPESSIMKWILSSFFPILPCWCWAPKLNGWWTFDGSHILWFIDATHVPVWRDCLSTKTTLSFLVFSKTEWLCQLQSLLIPLSCGLDVDDNAMTSCCPTTWSWMQRRVQWDCRTSLALTSTVWPRMSVKKQSPRWPSKTEAHQVLLNGWLEVVSECDGAKSLQITCSGKIWVVHSDKHCCTCKPPLHSNAVHSWSCFNSAANLSNCCMHRLMALLKARLGVHCSQMEARQTHGKLWPMSRSGAHGKHVLFKGHIERRLAGLEQNNLTSHACFTIWIECHQLRHCIGWLSPQSMPWEVQHGPWPFLSWIHQQGVVDSTWRQQTWRHSGQILLHERTEFCTKCCSNVCTSASKLWLLNDDGSLGMHTQHGAVGNTSVESATRSFSWLHHQEVAGLCGVDKCGTFVGRDDTTDEGWSGVILAVRRQCALGGTTRKKDKRSSQNFFQSSFVEPPLYELNFCIMRRKQRIVAKK